MKTVSMKYTPAEAKEETIEAAEVEAPQYPYGLTLYLSDESLDKLGITDVTKLKIGQVMDLVGKVKVVGTSEREYEGGSHRCLDLQITDMGLGKGKSSSVGNALYGGGEDEGGDFIGGGTA